MVTQTDTGSGAEATDGVLAVPNDEEEQQVRKGAFVQVLASQNSAVADARFSDDEAETAEYLRVVSDDVDETAEDLQVVPDYERRRKEGETAQRCCEEIISKDIKSILAQIVEHHGGKDDGDFNEIRIRRLKAQGVDYLYEHLER